MSDPRTSAREAQFSAAEDGIIQFTKAGAEPRAGLKSAEVPCKRVRRTAWQEGNALRDPITTLRSRRF